MQFLNLSRAESNQFTDVVISGRFGRIGQNKSDLKKVVPRFLEFRIWDCVAVLQPQDRQETKFEDRGII